MLTPQEVSERAFQKASFGGYNMAQVDEFLDILTGDYTSLYNENAVLKNKMKVLVDSYGGLRVPRKALRYNDKDERGVYIVRSSTISFRKVDVVYWGDDYVICSQKNEDGFLMLYDEIVTEGKELFDGKVIE